MLNGLDKLSLWSGKLVSWFILLMMIFTCLVVLLRYGLGIGSIALQEAVNYCHATAFLLGAAYTLQQDEHVRVDIFYQSFSARGKAWVNACGTIVFLIPFALFLLFTSWQFFLSAWQIREASPEPGGLPFLYLFKGLMPLAMLLLLMQALSVLGKAARTLIVKER